MNMTKDNKEVNIPDNFSLDIIIRKMLLIDTGTYGYQDKYIGRMPRLLLDIPEAGIFECNPEYSGLMFEYVTGALDERNISPELLAQLKKDIFYIFRLDLVETSDVKNLMKCVGFGPTGFIRCDEEISCDDVMICDYKPFEVYEGYAPYRIDEFTVTKNIVRAVKVYWGGVFWGTQPITYDLVRKDPETGVERRIYDIEEDSLIYVDYGPALFKLIAMNEYGTYESPWTEGEALMPDGIGKDCCSTAVGRCQNFNVMADNGLDIETFITHGDEYFTSFIYGSCKDYDNMPENPCMPDIPCEGPDCPDCIGFNVYNPQTENFDKFYDSDDSRLMISDYMGSCKKIVPKPGLDCGDENEEDHVFTVLNETTGEYDRFVDSDGSVFMVDPMCPECIDFNVYDEETNEFINYVTYQNRYYVVSRSYETCTKASDIIPKPVFGNDCACEPCQECLQFNTFDKETGLMKKFIPDDDDRMFVSLTEGSCGEIDPEPPKEGLDCEDCPDCILMHVYSGRKIGGVKQYDQLVAYRSRVLVGKEFNSCDDGNMAPSPIEVMSASTDERGRIIIEWERPDYGNPEPGYSLYRDGAEIATNITSPYVDMVDEGIYTYNLIAINTSGSSRSENFSGESLEVTNIPNKPLFFYASSNREWQIEVTFEESTSGTTGLDYNLYIDGELAASKINSGYIHDIAPGNYRLYLEARNDSGEAYSDVVDGRSLTVMETLVLSDGSLYIVVPAQTLKVST